MIQSGKHRVIIEILCVTFRHNRIHKTASGNVTVSRLKSTLNFIHRVTFLLPLSLSAVILIFGGVKKTVSGIGTRTYTMQMLCEIFYYIVPNTIVNCGVSVYSRIMFLSLHAVLLVNEFDLFFEMMNDLIRALYVV